MSRKRRGRDSRAAAGNDGAIGHARSMQIEGRRSNDQGHHPFLGSRAETMSSMHGSSAGLGSQMSTQSIYSNSTGAGTRPSVNEAFDDGEVQYVQDELAVLNEEVQAGNMRAFGSNTESVFEQLEAIRTQQFELVKSFVDMDQRISEQRNSDHDVQAVIQVMLASIRKSCEPMAWHVRSHIIAQFCILFRIRCLYCRSRWTSTPSQESSTMRSRICYNDWTRSPSWCNPFQARHPLPLRHLHPNTHPMPFKHHKQRLTKLALRCRWLQARGSLG
eukprot:TRINITY_DN4761_c0_g1_i1.p1 TRINITY_DN4761_c0_g1~~TRINITY_DN4761_c0_g1_i1.p1  ORF type:complete len:274 (+),score=18.37 TRINITY_DN4761_c0_g1_i1:128-949(+)